MVLCKDDNGDGLFSKSIRVWTKSVNGESDHYKSPSFPPLGYPRNVTVYPIDEGLMVHWQTPEYGFEYLKLYVVRWNPIADDSMFRTAETMNTTYLSNS